jgi:adenylate cyclase
MAAETGSWPTSRSATLDWLVNETAGERFLDNLFAQFCNRLRAEGVPLDRTTLHLRTLHPQFMGARLLWRPGMDEADLFLLEHSVAEEPRFLNSPVVALYHGVEGVRRRLDLDAGVEAVEYAIYADLRAQGFTDYVALPLAFTDGRRHASSWATTRPGGFSTEHLLTISELLPVLGMAIEIRQKNRMTKNLLNAYVGSHASDAILNGAITRGTGMTVRAAIWVCDLRGFTAISESWPRDDVIAMLNEYFDTMAEPVERHDGQILKFIGDAMLAMFPIEEEDACGNAIRAAIEARRGMRALNRARVERGQQALGFGVGLHIGDVMYGNIGSKSRLDFTVIGPAVNVATRLEGLSKELRREVLISGAFVRACPCGGLGLEPLGAFPLRGVGEPLEVFALPEPT